MRRPLGKEERADWLCLIRSENVGPATFHALIERFGSAAEALEALPRLAQHGGLKRRIRVASAATLERELDLAERSKARHVFLGDAHYPVALAAIHAPPPVLTVRGDVGLLARDPIAVVGARKASGLGRTMARMLAGAFADAGLAVVSGLALGIDGEAHKAALDGGTVAVLAGGVDTPTPTEHAQLAEQIAERGALVSEMPPGTNPVARDFPRRNRIIAGLCRGVVVVEAAAGSGSLHTARYANAENREVFAVPGSPLDPRAAGCLALLRDGATMVVEPDDVLMALAALPRLIEPLGLAEDEAGQTEADAQEDAPTRDCLERVAEALSPVPQRIDTLVRLTGLTAREVLTALVELELAGRAERELGGTVRAALPPGR